MVVLTSLRKFLLTGVPLMLTTLVNDSAVSSMYGTIVVGLCAMLYSGNNAYR